MKAVHLFVPLALLSACSPNRGVQEVNEKIDSSVEQNKSAASFNDWHASNSNPERIIGELSKAILSKELTPEQVCESFEGRTSAELTLFENYIRDPNTQFIFKPCQDSLLRKLDAHWEAEKEELKKIRKERESKSTSSKAPDLIFRKGGDAVDTFEEPSISQTVKMEKMSTESSFFDAEESDGLRRFERIISVERDVSAGYYAVTGDLPIGQVALTFDDGPHATYTDDVLKALAEANVAATFFVKGNNVKQYPDALKRIAKAGHAIGTHTMTHRCQASNNRCQKNNSGHRLSVEEAMRDIASAHKLVRDLIGWVFPFFRFPYGESSPDLKSFLKDTGTGEFYWSVDSNDWRSHLPDGKPYTASMMVDEIMNQLKSKRRGIILNHDIQKKTAIALPEILNRLHEDGLQPIVFVPKNREEITNSKLVETVYNR